MGGSITIQNSNLTVQNLPTAGKVVLATSTKTISASFLPRSYYNVNTTSNAMHQIYIDVEYEFFISLLLFANMFVVNSNGKLFLTAIHPVKKHKLSELDIFFIFVGSIGGAMAIIAIVVCLWRRKLRATYTPIGG